VDKKTIKIMSTIALCLSGQIRSFDLVKKSLADRLLSKYEIDIFCHFWHRYDGISYQSYFHLENPEMGTDGTNYGKFNDYKIEDIVSFLKPKSLKYEFPSIPENSKSMLYSVRESNNLKTEYEKLKGFKYDIVIKSRYDLFYERDINLLETIDNVVYTINRPGGKGGINDWFVYGKSDEMSIFMDTYSTFEDSNRVKDPCPESLYLEQIRNHNINHRYINRDFVVMRADGYKMDSGNLEDWRKSNGIGDFIPYDIKDVDKIRKQWKGYE